MRHRERQTATLLSVSEAVVGTTLSADAASGATTLFVDDVSVFDESGWLMVGTQVVKYTAIDDDAGTVTLATALTSAADTDDPVYRYSKLYGDVETVLSAQVAVLGDRDQADELTVEVADTLDIPTGDRGGDGENCLIESDGDVWTLIHASGRPSKARGIKFEADDFYVVTSADVTAGTATIPLSHSPVAESVKLWWRTVAQEPTEYTVNASAQTITLPLGSFAAAGDRIWVHYAYRMGLVQQTGPVGFTGVGYQWLRSYGTNFTSISFPAGSQPTDLFVLAAMGGSVACGDARASQVGSAAPIGADGTCLVWKGAVGDGSALSINVTAAVSWGCNVILFVLHPDTPIAFDGRQVTGVDATGTVPGLSGTGSGAVAVVFYVVGLGGGVEETWPSPWVDRIVTVDKGANFCIDIATQAAGTIGSTPALDTTHEPKAWVIGLGEG